MFTIDWQFSSRRGLSSASFDEMADPAPYDEAYPTLAEPVANFIARYLASRETVLILQGPPGTGKTRLVRAILAAMSARKADSAQVLYTADMRALANDEIFVDFITGNHDAFVIEDADHLLMARSNGNVDLTRHWCGRAAALRRCALGRWSDARRHRCWRGFRPRAVGLRRAESLGWEDTV